MGNLCRIVASLPLGSPGIGKRRYRRNVGHGTSATTAIFRMPTLRLQILTRISNTLAAVFRTRRTARHFTSATLSTPSIQTAPLGLCKTAQDLYRILEQAAAMGS